MAHGLRYYKELTHDDGKVVRLEILEKGYTGASMEIGPVCQALRLDIQGDTEIDAPIVKTRLSMTFVDAPDHADAKTKKCGNWQEFYTSDATKWQVIIKVKKEAGQNFVTMWGGYITPDSYNEVLVYRGSVTLVARDNIGHMNDFPFDAEGDENGMISMRDVISGAWAKIESPMSLRLYHDDWMLTNNVVAYNTMMNVSAFEGKSWGEAVEMVLFAYGATLRYVGYNDVAIRPLRWIPQMGAAQGEAVKAIEPIFISGAERELTPAVRRIEETIDYQIDPYTIQQVKETDYTGSTDNFIIEGKSYERSGIAWPILNQDYGNGWRNGEYSSFFNPNAYPFHNDKDGDKKFMFLIANNQFVPLNDSAFSARYAEWSKYINVDRVVFNLSLGARYLLLDGVLRDYSGFYNYTTAKVGVYVKLADGTTYYLKSNGEWGLEESLITTEISSNSITIEANIALVASDSVLFGVRIYQILTTAEGHAANYCAVQSASLSVSNALLETNRVNTNYEQQNNVILSREPKLGPAINDVALTSIIRNGIFIQEGMMFGPTQRWAWPGTTPQQMAVYNHLQLLCYHAKPNNVIRGTIVNADLADLRVIWMWHGAEHMLVSGSINYLNGYIENAVLREFARYEDMWGMLEPADLPDVEGSSSTNVESGASSGSKGASITNRTEVYIGGGGGSITLDSFMSDTSENGVMNRVIKAYVDDVRSDLTDLWHLDENGNLVTDKQVIIKNNLLVDGDAASGGEGQDTPTSGIRGIYVNNVPYTDTDGDGFIDLGTISGGGGTADLSNYYTKGESDARYLASSLLGSNTLIHSGNIGSYAFVPKSEIANNTDADYLLTNGVYLNATGNGGGNSNFPSSYSAFLTFSQSSKYAAQISIGSNAIHMRRKIDSWSHWMRIIAENENGNVGIGTTNPTSKLHIVHDTFPNILLESTSVESSIYFKSLYTGQGWAAGTGVWNQHFGIGIYEGGTSQWILSLRKDCGTDIRGGLQIYRQFYGNFDEGIRVVGASNEYCGIFLGTDSQYYGYTEHQWNLMKTNADTFAIARGLSTNVFFQIYNNGDTYIYRNLIVSGDTSSGSDIRFKDVIKNKTLKIEHIAKAPLFTFKWNDRDDDTIHLGSSAQYWENIAPWLVSGSDFKSLNYATLGVAMGISLAKKAVNHEERIKVLEKENKVLKETIRRMEYGG